MSTPGVRLLTGGDLELDPELGADLSAPMPRALFVALLLIGAEPVPREYLSTLLWPDTDAAAGRQRLRMTLHKLRRGLGPVLEAALGVTPDALSFGPARVGVDLVEFQRHGGGGTAASRRRAIALYKGDLLERFPPISGTFDDLLDQWRQDCRAAFLSICWRALREDIEAGDVAAYDLLLEKALRIDRTNVDLVADAMRFHAAAGGAQRVTDVFDRHAHALRSDIDVEPEPELLALRDDMRALALKQMQARAPPATGPGPPAARAPANLLATTPAPRRPASFKLLAAGAVIVVVAVGAMMIPSPPSDLILKLPPVAPTSGDCGLPEARTMFEDATEAAVSGLEGTTVVLVGETLDGEVFTLLRQVDCDGLNARGTLTVVREPNNEIRDVRRYDLTDVREDELAKEIMMDLREVLSR